MEPSGARTASLNVKLSAFASARMSGFVIESFRSENGGTAKALLDVFDAPKTPPMLKLAQDMMSKVRKAYYFDKGTGVVHDISALDPSAEEDGEAGWGGLSEFSGRASAAVASAVANVNRQPSK